MTEREKKYASIAFDELLHATPKANLFRIANRPVWIPKSVCNLSDDETVLWVETWFIEKTGLEAFIEEVQDEEGTE